jgi:hypothetical protein
VAFIDLAGNAWLIARGVMVDRRGFANPAAQTRLPRGPFSDKASLVVRSLFESPGRRGVRDLAGELELNPGYVSKILQELDRRGYLARSDEGVRLRHAGELLRDWLHFYRGHGPVVTRTYFAPATSAKVLMRAIREASFAARPGYGLTMQAGASLVARYAEFDTVEMYVQGIDLADEIAHELKARPTRQGANLAIMLPYYRVSAFRGIRRIGGVAVVSDLQLYLDLYDFPIRGREQAERIFERRLLPRLRELEEGE